GAVHHGPAGVEVDDGHPIGPGAAEHAGGGRGIGCGGHAPTVLPPDRGGCDPGNVIITDAHERSENTMDVVSSLTDALPAEAVTTYHDSMDAYRWDPANGADAGVPLAVVRAASTAEVQPVVRIAAEAKVPIVPRGAGAGLSGGSSAIAGGIVLSLDRMRQIS